jgi:hypothetical protein
MRRAITRRSALKKVAAGTAGVAAAVSLSEHPSPAAETEFRVGGEKEKYETPSIRWREELGPTPMVSCAKQPGNPGCNPGPFTN